MYVYRDTSEPPGAASGEPPENDAAYWYDLPRTGDGADAPPRAVLQTRGPFEPLVSSAGPAGEPRSAGPDQALGHAHEDTETAHARKLEQIKDLYLTAEAIGEANVDKHFDQLLSQQRELISDYFGHSGAARPAGPAGQAAEDDPADTGYPLPAPASPDQAETDPGIPRHSGLPAAGPAAAAKSGRVTADQPRAW